MTFSKMLRGSEDGTISKDELIMQMEEEAQIGHGKRKSSQLTTLLSDFRIEKLFSSALTTLLMK